MSTTVWKAAVWEGSAVVSKAAVKAAASADFTKIAANLIAKLEITPKTDAVTITRDHREDK